MYSHRLLFFSGFLICAVLIATALIFQHILELEPCPLCILQRIAVMAAGGVFLLAALHNPGKTGRFLYGLLVLISAVVGLTVAGRQVWLQHLPPDRVPECGPGLDYMLEVFPLGDALAMVFRGSGECAEVQWTFIGFSIPEWMIVAFALLILLALFTIIKRE